MIIKDFYKKNKQWFWDCSNDGENINFRTSEDGTGLYYQYNNRGEWHLIKPGSQELNSIAININYLNTYEASLYIYNIIETYMPYITNIKEDDWFGPKSGESIKPTCDLDPKELKTIFQSLNVYMPPIKETQVETRIYEEPLLKTEIKKSVLTIPSKKRRRFRRRPKAFKGILFKRRIEIKQPI